MIHDATLQLLASTLVAGLAAGGLALLVRATCSTWPQLGRFLQWYKGKPLTCPACMAGWCAMPTVALAAWGAALPLWTLPLVYLGATAVGAYVNAMAMPAFE